MHGSLAQQAHYKLQQHRWKREKSWTPAHSPAQGLDHLRNGNILAIRHQKQFARSIGVFGTKTQETHDVSPRNQAARITDTVKRKRQTTSDELEQTAEVTWRIIGIDQRRSDNHQLHTFTPEQSPQFLLSLVFGDGIGRMWAGWRIFVESLLPGAVTVNAN